MEVAKQMPVSDDEEDLEALRLAALQSLKRKNAEHSEDFQSSKASYFTLHNEHESRYDQAVRGRPHGNFSNKRGRFFSGRGAKNGQFHGGRIRSSNLISITPVGTEDDKKIEPLESSGTSKLILPQDRYTNTATEENKSDETSSKFDRFNDSDKTDNESEEEALKTDSDEDDSIMKLERSDSLEALMQELDDEIQGKPKAKEKPAKVKSKTKRKKEKSISDNEVDGKKVENEPKEENIEEMQTKDEKCENTTKQETTELPKVSPTRLAREKSEEKEPQYKKRKHSPPVHTDVHNFRDNSSKFPRSSQYQKTQFLPNVSMHYPPGNSVFNSAFGPPNLVGPPIKPPPFYERPLSPLLINADTLQTQTMAPLSPRSAAFVLQNRAIIEKRKRSPRRSYSRSPSPRSRSISPRSPRRSLSPRRPLSPRRILSPRRSMSPRRSLSPRRRSRSPKRRSLSPKRRSPSPRQKTFSPKLRQYSPKIRPFSPKRRSPSPRRRSMSPRRRDRKESDNSKNKPSIRNRLGFKSLSKTDNKDIKDRSPSDLSPKKDDKPLDPILEARKRKFETKEIKIREGVIRLRPKEEREKVEKINLDIEKTKEEKNDTNEEINNTKGEKSDTKDNEVLLEDKKLNEVEQQHEGEIINEDILLEDDELELEPKVDLFSDEESGSENEGRFKAKEQVTVKCVTVPLSKSINGMNKEVEQKSLSQNKKKQFSDRLVARSRSPQKKDNEKFENKKSVDSSGSIKRSVKSDRSSIKKRIILKSERHPTSKRFERKIEIKIKNPSKYEKEEKPEVVKDSKEKIDRTFRKVELGNFTSTAPDDDDDFETEIVVENDEDEAENTLSNEGDLRAQLSKKRAEKMNKNTTNEGVSSRLLQNALQNALPLKKSKKSKSKELSSSDGKLPIHLRLGIACSSDVYTKSKRKLRKRKNVESEDQV